MAQPNRVWATLPGEYKRDLETWAEAEAEPPSSLAARLLISAIDAARGEGRIPLRIDRYKSLSHLILKEFDALVTADITIPLERLKELRDGKGEAPTEVELLKLAIALRFSESEIRSLPYQKRGNGHEARVG